MTPATRAENTKQAISLPRWHGAGTGRSVCSAGIDKAPTETRALQERWNENKQI